MPEWLNRFLSRVGETWKNLEGNQKRMLIFSTLFGVLIVGLILYLAGKPDYGVLYSRLSEEEAGDVVQVLQEQKVEYRLADEGRTILVPRKVLQDTRISLASKGVVGQRVQGYEMLDNRNNLGESERFQKLNQKRALEGELARTIGAMKGIRAAYVKIVIPEPSLFTEEKLDPTASITLDLASTSSLDRQQVNGIARMVSGSVAGLKAEDATIIDSWGNILSDPTDDSSVYGLTNRQLDVKNRVDRYLTRKAQSMLDRVVGPGHAAAQISADLNFSRIEKTSELYDPEQQVVRSEEREESSETAQDTTEALVENSISNYEINRIVEHLVNQVGNVSRLSVSLVVDGTWQETPEGESTFTPRSESELEALSEMVRSAVGFDAGRNDQVSIRCIPFDRTWEQKQETGYQSFRQAFFYSDLLKKILFVLAILMFFMVSRRSLFKMNALVQTGFEEKYQQIEKMADQMDSETDQEEFLDLALDRDVTEEEKRLKTLHNQVKGFTEKTPEEAIRLLRTWYIDPEK